MLRRVLGISLCAVLLSLVILTQRFPRMDPDELDPSADQMREEKWLQKERTWLTQAKRRGISKGKGKAVSNIQELWRKDNLGGLGLDRIRLPGDKDSTVAPAFAFDSAADLSKRWTRQSGANPCWWIRNQSRCLPAFMIIGTMKAGTTALATYLQYHPALYLSRLKEPYFFNPSCGRKCPKDSYQFNLRYYFSLFPSFPAGDDNGSSGATVDSLRPWLPKPGELRAFEASPSYLFSSPLTPNFVKKWMQPSSSPSDVPGGKFVVLVRDPVDRAYSQFQLALTLRDSMGAQCSDELITRGFDSLVDDSLEQLGPCATKLLSARPNSTMEQQTADYWAAVDREYYDCKRAPPPSDRCARIATPSSLLNPGLYFYHLRRWMRAVGRHNVLVIDNAELEKKPVDVMAKTFAFLGMSARSNAVTAGVLRELQRNPKLLSKRCPTFFGVESQKEFKPELLFGNSGDNRDLAKSLLEAMVGKGHADQVSTAECDKLGVKDVNGEGNKKSKRYPPMSAASRVKLAAFFAPHNHRLYRLLKRNLNWTTTDGS